MKLAYDANVHFTSDTRLRGVRGERGRFTALLMNDYNLARVERHVANVVIDYGTTPNDELYRDLKPRSINLGEVDLDAFASGRPQRVNRNANGIFALFRIGDAAASRNVHAAVFDALRLCAAL
jgi:hypothetical protein